MKYYDKLIFELSKSGRRGCSLPENKWAHQASGELPDNLRRAKRRNCRRQASPMWCATTRTFRR